MEIKQVGVIGAGVMGHGIGQVCAQVAKTEVILRDVSEELVQRGLEGIKGFLQGTVDRGRITKEEAEGVLSRINSHQQSLLEASSGFCHSKAFAAGRNTAKTVSHPEIQTLRNHLPHASFPSK